MTEGNKAVILVDDDPTDIEIFRSILEGGDFPHLYGIKIDPWTEPPADVHKYCGAHAVMLDLFIGAHLGVDEAKRIRRVYPDMPIMLLSGAANRLTPAIREAFDCVADKSSLNNIWEASRQLLSIAEQRRAGAVNPPKGPKN